MLNDRSKSKKSKSERNALSLEYQITYFLHRVNCGKHRRNRHFPQKTTTLGYYLRQFCEGLTKPFHKRATSGNRSKDGAGRSQPCPEPAAPTKVWCRYCASQNCRARGCPNSSNSPREDGLCGNSHVVRVVFLCGGYVEPVYLGLARFPPAGCGGRLDVVASDAGLALQPARETGQAERTGRS
jgi:hypothetical protein